MSKPPEKLAKVAGEAADLDNPDFITGWLVDTLDRPHIHQCRCIRPTNAPRRWRRCAPIGS